MEIIIGAILITISLLMSSEQFRRGALADQEEINERATKGDNGCGFMVAAILIGLLGLLMYGSIGGV